MDPNICLKSFLDSVRSYRETGDENEALQAKNFHVILDYWLNHDGFEPNWSILGTSKEEFYSYTADGRFTIKIN